MHVEIVQSTKLNRHDVYWRLGCYKLGSALVTKLFVLEITMMYHNLKDIYFEDPLDGSLSEVSIQDLHVAYMTQAILQNQT